MTDQGQFVLHGGTTARMRLRDLAARVNTEPVLAGAVEDARRGDVTALDLSTTKALRPFVVAALAGGADVAGAGRTVLAVTATTRESEDLAAALECLLEPGSVVQF